MCPSLCPHVSLITSLRAHIQIQSHSEALDFNIGISEETQFGGVGCAVTGRIFQVLLEPVNEVFGPKWWISHSSFVLENIQDQKYHPKKG